MAYYIKKMAIKLWNWIEIAGIKWNKKKNAGDKNYQLKINYKIK